MRKNRVFVLLTVFVLAEELKAQAPGDERFDRCTRQVDSDNEKTLMDSYHYANLLPGNGTGFSIEDDAVWNDRSYDGNDAIDLNNPTYWQQGAGGTCRYQVRVCGFDREGALQNNWLFTQHINKDFDANIYNYPVDMRLEIRYSGISCRPRHGCNPNFSILTYITNNLQLPSTRGNGYMNRTNYRDNRTISPEETSTPYTEIHSFTLQPSQTGLYLAIQDYGTCLSISRMRVYHNNCKGGQTGLVIYPDAPAPSQSFQTIDIACAVNSEKVPGKDTVNCHSDGLWGAESPECVCSDGYEIEVNGLSCKPCGPGYFTFGGRSNCTLCPANSASDDTAASQCQCLQDHYRIDDDTKSGPCNSSIETNFENCTASPSQPTDVTTNVTNTTLSVCWGPPESNGGRDDLFYKVELCPVLSCTDDSKVTTEISSCSDFSRKCYIFTGLQPVTQYVVTVTSENGVSYQNERDEKRHVRLEIKTDEGYPEVVSNPTAVDNIVLVWGPPEVPNGVITGYKIFLTFCPMDPFSGSGMTDVPLESSELKCESEILTHDTNKLFLVLNFQILPQYEHTVTFTISAKTGEDRYGEWSQEQTIIPKIVCPAPPPCPSATPPHVPTISHIAATSTIFTPMATPMTTPMTEDPSIATEDPSIEITIEEPSIEGASSKEDCVLEDCVIFMAATAGAVAILSTLLTCVFSYSIACLCHKHKMKTYKLKVKKHMQSKWDY